MENPIIFDITIDPLYSKDGQELEIEQIAFVKHPAVLVKGFAFEENVPKKLIFADDVKMRIAAPALIPMSIYRNDEDGEYFVRFSTEVIEQLHSKLMKNLQNKPNLFNIEHNSKDTAPAYILEAWLVGKTPQADRSYSEFGIEVPTGTLFIVAQVTDRGYYDELIKNDQTGFSIEGFLGLKLSEMGFSLSHTEQLKTQTKMKKNSFDKASLKKVKLASMAIADTNMTLEIDGDLVEGSAVTLKDADGTYDAPDGDITLADGTIVSITSGKIVTVTPATETPEAEPVAVEAEDEAPVAEPVTEPVIDEAAIMAIMQPKFDEIYSLIAEVKALVQSGEVAPTEDVAPVAMSAQDKRVIAALSFAKLKQLR